MRYSDWASRVTPRGVPDPLMEMARLSESSQTTSLARRSAQERRREMMDRVESVTPSRLGSTPPSPQGTEQPSLPSEGQREPAAIHIIPRTRRTHGGDFGRSIADSVIESYE